MATILIVEDECNLSNLIRGNLEEDRYCVTKTRVKNRMKIMRRFRPFVCRNPFYRVTTAGW